MSSFVRLPGLRITDRKSRFHLFFRQTRELQIRPQSFDAPRQHLYPVTPTLRIIPFLHGKGFALRVRPCWRKNGLAFTDSVLAYGQRGGLWPARLACRVS